MHVQVEATLASELAMQKHAMCKAGLEDAPSYDLGQLRQCGCADRPPGSCKARTSDW